MMETKAFNIFTHVVKKTMCPQIMLAFRECVHLPQPGHIKHGYICDLTLWEDTTPSQDGLDIDPGVLVPQN